MARALIADDEEDMLLLLQATIEGANRGLSIAGVARDGLDAVSQWRATRPDVVVLDQRMPGLTGLEAAARMLAEEPDLPIVLFSAFIDSALTDAAHRLGVRICMQKDKIFDLPDVLRGVAT